MSNPIAAFQEAMRAAGIVPTGPIADKLASGQPFRFRAEGDKPGRRNGWAWLHLDGVPAGVFRHYRLGIRMVWSAGSDPRSLSPAERRALMAQVREGEAQRQAATLAKQEAAAGEAKSLWQEAGKADQEHGYLRRKGLPPFGVRQHRHALLVPMVDAAFQLRNVQTILPDGRKRFLPGGRIDGLFWLHAAMMRDGSPSASPLVIGEGFATMAAIHHATGYGVVAALSARNLEAVALAMRKLFPSRPLIIAADDDSHLPENIGLEAAAKAAEAIGARLAVPRPLASGVPSGAAGAEAKACQLASPVTSAARCGEMAHV